MPAGGSFIFQPYALWLRHGGDTLGPKVTKFGTQVKTNKGYLSIQILGGLKNYGVKILDFRKKKSICIISESILTKYKKWCSKILGVKILDFRNFGYSKKYPSHYNFDIQGNMKKCRALLSKFTQK